MTKPLTKEQKAANKAARFEKKQTRIDSANQRAEKRAAVVKPIASAGDGIEQQSDGALVSTDRPEVITPLPEPDTSPNLAQVDARARRKLDTDTERKQPLKGVRGKVAPKPAKEPAKRAGRKTATDEPREKKYIDHGTSAKHRFEGTMWNGSKVRTASGGYGLQLSADGKVWHNVRTEKEFYSPNPDRWRRALQQAQRDKSELPPNAAKGQPRAERVPSMATPSGRKIKATNGSEPKPRRSRKAAENGASDAIQSEEERTAWKRAFVSPTCMWSDVIQGQPKCSSISQRRVVCCGGKRFADVCEKHEKAFLTTKSSKWVGCVSYQLTPNGVKLDGERRLNAVPADQAVSV